MVDSQDKEVESLWWSDTNPRGGVRHWVFEEGPLCFTPLIVPSKENKEKTVPNTRDTKTNRLQILGNKTYKTSQKINICRLLI